jgi:hypothetical protein
VRIGEEEWLDPQWNLGRGGFVSFALCVDAIPTAITVGPRQSSDPTT